MLSSSDGGAGVRAPVRFDDDEPLRLPAAVPAPSRPAVPFAAAIVPVVGSLVLWQVTGSLYALWFAALGPLMALASFVDGMRSSRRLARRGAREASRQLGALIAEVDRRHAAERARAWRATPDVAGYARDPDEIWRRVPGRGETLVVGRGEAASAVRLTGEAHNDGSRELRRRASVARDMPVRVPLTAGIAVCGPPTLTAAVVRGLLLQLCLAHPPGALRIEHGEDGLAAALPHAYATGGLGVIAGTVRGALPGDVDIALVCVAAGEPPPPRCAVVLTLVQGNEARVEYEGRVHRVHTEAISHEQARTLAAELAERGALLGHHAAGVVSLTELSDVSMVSGSPLLVAIGVSGGEPVALDLVSDGPHAVVIGTTGSGKSELLMSWIVGLCRSRSPQEVAFLLVDFKGGRTFDALAGFPHVTGVVTDLDEAQALRAVQSLRAEIRHRERVLAACNARDVTEATGALGRLVIVVDEYAALVSAHAELHELFADIAARGRALGMHLVLASQRAAGAFRDGVLANAPLRIAFRVTDAADSRAVLGDDEAVRLSGAPTARGTALVRGAADAAPRLVRVARCEQDFLTEVERHVASQEPARRPWLPPLPSRITLAHLREDAGLGGTEGGLVLGLADEPERQSREIVTLAAEAPGFVVIGGAASGRTSLLRAVESQAAVAVWVPNDLEAAWDAICDIDRLRPGTDVLIDDADALLARFPPEYAAAWLAACERLAREARSRSLRVVISLARATGGLARIVDLLPQRAVLGLPSRADHVAVGGEAADFDPALPPGRGRWGRRLVQFALPDDAPAARRWSPIETAPPWNFSSERDCAVVVPPGARGDAVSAAARAAGREVTPVAEAALRALEDLPARETTTGGEVIVGVPEDWLSHWRVLAAARARRPLIIDAGCAAEFRTLTALRELPPYVSPGRDRAWIVLPGGEVHRTSLPVM